MALEMETQLKALEKTLQEKDSDKRFTDEVLKKPPSSVLVQSTMPSAAQAEVIQE